MSFDKVLSILRTNEQYQLFVWPLWHIHCIRGLLLLSSFALYKIFFFSRTYDVSGPTFWRQRFSAAALTRSFWRETYWRWEFEAPKRSGAEISWLQYKLRAGTDWHHCNFPKILAMEIPTWALGTKLISHTKPSKKFQLPSVKFQYLSWGPSDFVYNNVVEGFVRMK